MGATRRPGDDTFGRGVNIQDGSFEGSRLFVSENHDVGFFVAGSDAVVSLQDATIEWTRAEASDLTGGSGVVVQEGANFGAIRLLVADNREAGLYVLDDGTTVSLIDAAIVRTQFRESDGMAGRGVGVQSGASLSAERLLVASSCGVLIAPRRQRRQLGQHIASCPWRGENRRGNVAGLMQRLVPNARPHVRR